MRFIAGYRAGALRANLRVRVLVNYANDPTFADQAKCKETTLNQIERGSKIAFMVAGQCGLGGLTATKERKIWGIGVDADQGFLGKHSPIRRPSSHRSSTSSPARRRRLTSTSTT